MSMLGGMMSMVGGVVGAQGAMQEAQSKAKAEIYNAEVADRNRKIIGQQTIAAVKDKRSENRRVIHAFRAAYGKSNIDMSGSAVDVIHDTAIEQFLDIRRIKYAGKLKQIEMKDQAKLHRMAAAADIEAGQISATSQILGGLSGLVGSLGSMASGGTGGFGGLFGGGGSGGATGTAGLGGSAITEPLAPASVPVNVPIPRIRPPAYSSVTIPQVAGFPG